MAAKSKQPKGEPTWSSPAYISECEARSRKIKISYVDREHWVTARLVHSWKREDPEIKRGPVMSASSGPKDSTLNRVIALFEANDEIGQIALLVLNLAPFFIVHVGPYWYDRSEPPRLVMVKPEG